MATSGDGNDSNKSELKLHTRLAFRDPQYVEARWEKNDNGTNTRSEPVTCTYREEFDKDNSDMTTFYLKPVNPVHHVPTDDGTELDQSEGPSTTGQNVMSRLCGVDSISVSAPRSDMVVREGKGIWTTSNQYLSVPIKTYFSTDGGMEFAQVSELRPNIIPLHMPPEADSVDSYRLIDSQSWHSIRCTLYDHRGRTWLVPTGIGPFFGYHETRDYLTEVTKTEMDDKSGKLGCPTSGAYMISLIQHPELKSLLRTPQNTATCPTDSRDQTKLIASQAPDGSLICNWILRIDDPSGRIGSTKNKHHSVGSSSTKKSGGLFRWRLKKGSTF